jgi:hypothetical protein
MVAAPIPAKALKIMRVGKAMGALEAGNCVVVTPVGGVAAEDVAVMVAKDCWFLLLLESCG